MSSTLQRAVPPPVPRVPAADPETRSASAHAREKAGIADDALIVDPDPVRGPALASALSALGLAVRAVVALPGADGPAEAAVILVRRKLQEGDAFAFVRELRKRTELPPRVLVLADAPSTEDTLRAIDAGAAGILFEPHTPSTVADRIRRLAQENPLQSTDDADVPTLRIKGPGGVVYKLKARPELLADYLLRATDSLAAIAPPPLPDTPEVVVREDRRIVYANEAARRLLHLPENIGDATFDAPLDVARTLERRIKSGRRQIDVLIRARETVFEGASAYGVTLRDVTELRNLESQLRLSNDILDRVPAVVLVTDPQGRVAYAGPGIGTLLGYSPDEVLAEGFWNLAWPDLAAAERMRSALMDAEGAGPGAVHAPHQARLRSRDGAARHLAFQFAAGPGGTRIIVGQDITATKAAEESSARAREAAESAAAAKSDFLANMSHEIRTPLNAVIGLTSLLLETSLDGQQRDYAEIIRTSGESLLALISDILDFSKIEAGKFEVARRPCSAESLVEQCLDILSGRAAEKGIDLAGCVEPLAAIEFWGDDARIRQILVNLLANAVKFTETGGVLVDVRLLRPKRGADGEVACADLAFTVIDTGVGIPAERFDRLFQPFSQADASITRRYGGTGLGLAISKRLASMMGGAISAESTQGEGSRFTLTIPVDVIGRSVTAMQEPGDAWLSGRRVVLTATGPMTTDVVTRLVSRWGGDLVRASASELMDRLGRGEHFDAAILDYGRIQALSDLVPGLDLVSIKEQCVASDVPVIALRPIASRANPETQGLSLVSTPVPIRPVSFRRALDRAINRRREITDSIPVAAAAVTSSPAISASGPAADVASLSVLVAEDNLVNQKVARLTLLSLGFARVDVVKNGVEAVRAQADFDYDLVFLDLQMPEMDGFEAARRIRLKAPSPRPWIVALTANVLSDERQQCFDLGMDDFISKPLRRDDLAMTLDRARRARTAPAL